MTVAEHLKKAEKNLKKAEIAFNSQFNRNGIREQEKKNLADNVEHAKVVRDIFLGKLENERLES